MPGVKGRSGGARPGAGQKSKATEDYQASMRAAFEKRITPAAWARVIDTALEQATKGDTAARSWLTPWVVGAEPKEMKIEHSGEVGHKVYAGFDPGEV